MFKKAAAIIGGSIVVAISCVFYCQGLPQYTDAEKATQLEQLLQQKIVQRELLEWVDFKVRNAPNLDSKLSRPKRAGIGEHIISEDFNWSLLRIDPQSPDKQIRLIEDEKNTPIAVYFGEGTRLGALVSITGNFGTDPHYLIVVTDRIAVFFPGKIRPS